MKKRTLSLKRETLTDLTTGELGAVVGADAALSGITCPVLDCLNFSEPSTCFDCVTRTCF